MPPRPHPKDRAAAPRAPVRALPFQALLPLALALLLAACSRPAPAPEPVRAVRTLVVGVESAQQTLEFAAEVRARTESRLGFRVGGKVVAREAEIGQRVRAGQVLARLDPADLRLGQAAALAAVKAAEVNQAQAAADFRRYQSLREQGFISAIELDRRETTLQAAQAQLDQARAQAGVQGNQAAYAALTATAAGVITATEVEVGQVVSAGAPVLRLAHDGPRDVVFVVPEDAAAAIRALTGQRAALQVRPWGSTATLPATVREVAAAADPTTRTFQVKAGVADAGPAGLQLGQTVTVLLSPPAQPGAVKLPLSAVMQQEGRTAVWVLDRAAMTVAVQPVVVAGAEGNAVLIASGLQPGQTVVTAGVHTLNPGQKVRLYQAADARPAGAPGTPAAPAAAASR